MVVTGAGSGIGLATAALATQQGWSVIGVDKRDGDVNADLGTASGRDAALAAILTLIKNRPLDSFIACAGLSTGDASTIMSVNFFGVTTLADGLLPALTSAQHGRAAVISSNALLHTPLWGCTAIEAALAGNEEVATRTVADQPDLAYFTSKKALSLWVKREAVKPAWAGSGVLLNAIAPGATATPMIADILKDAQGRNFLKRMTPTRTGQPATAEDIAALACWLAGPANRFVAGQTIFCDGGAEATLRPDTI
jgi:NAD(P)-dependent dehydrogenase (short-subunit alcohol dehydrogenase family)